MKTSASPIRRCHAPFWRWAAPFLPIVSGLLGCAADRPLSVTLEPSVRRPARSAIIFFIDGFGRAQFDAALADGRIPHIRENLLERGTRVETAVACIPTITYANAVSLITGRFAGRHGIVSNKWFDPVENRYQNYCFIETYRDVDADYLGIPTIHELLPGRVTVSLQAAQRRGATHTIDNWATSGINWFFGNLTGVDCLVAQDFELIGRRAAGWGQWPDLILAYFPGVDEVGHRQGPTSRAYLDTVQNVDRQIGRICTALKDVGMYDRTLLCLVSDHGLVEIQPGKQFDVAAFLAERTGRRVWTERVCRDGRTRDELQRDYGFVVARSGDRWASIHAVRDRNGNASSGLTDYLASLAETDPFGTAAAPALEHATPRWIAELIRHPAVEIVACSPRPGLVVVLGSAGELSIRRSSDRPGSFEIVQSPSSAFIDAPDHDDSASPGFELSKRDSLARAVADRYPDLVPQLSALFESPRAGDLVVFAADGWEFKASPSAGGHGSILRDEVLIPMLFAGPDVPRGQSLPVARITDVMPTVLGWLGAGLKDTKDGGPMLDGVDLFDDAAARTNR